MEILFLFITFGFKSCIIPFLKGHISAQVDPGMAIIPAEVAANGISDGFKQHTDGLHCHSHYTAKDSDKGKQLCDSDSEYESFGETIDGSDNDQETEITPAMKNKPIINGGKTNTIKEASKFGVRQEIDNQKINTLSDYLLNSNNTKSNKSPSSNSSASFNSIPISKSHKDIQELFSNTTQHRQSDTNRHTISPSSKQSLSPSNPAQKRFETKREAWVTKPKGLTDFHDESANSRTGSVIKNLSISKITSSSRSNGKSLKKNVAEVKELRIGLKRLSKSTLRRYGCAISSFKSSGSSRSSVYYAGVENEASNFTKSALHRAKRNRTLPSLDDHFRSRQGIYHCLDDNNVDRKKRYVSKHLEKLNFESTQTKDHNKSRRKNGKAPSLRRKNSYISTLSSSSESDDYLQCSKGKKILTKLRLWYELGS